jgi:hypothetical protein
MYNGYEQSPLVNVSAADLAIFGLYKPEGDENWHFALFPDKRKDSLHITTVCEQ